MRYIDVSVPISSELPHYEGDPTTTISLWHSMAEGAVADVRTISMGAHTGTHVDAPAHFIPGGKTIDQIDLTMCLGPAVVLDLTDLASAQISRTDLAPRLPAGAERVLLHTRNSLLWQKSQFDPGYVALAIDAAQFLVEEGVRLIGIDYLSIAPFSDPASVHRILLGAGTLILEGLNLSGVVAGTYTLLCSPLRLEGAEAAPARALLGTEDLLSPR